MKHTIKTSTLTIAVAAAYGPERFKSTGGNPLLARLPDPPDTHKLAAALARTPPCAEDRSSSLSEKPQRAKSQRRPVIPASWIIELARGFDASLRAGYAMRNPNDAEIRRALDAGGDVQPRCEDFGGSHAGAITVLGRAGNARSTGIDAVLTLYPQVIRHGGDTPWTQIVYIKVEMPAAGSLKQLLAAFFAAVDHLLGTNYSEAYGNRAMTLDERLHAAERVVARHHIGFIIFEELQFLRVGGDIGAEQFAYLVLRLLNAARCPVMLIGTLAAEHFFSRNNRLARQAFSHYRSLA